MPKYGLISQTDWNTLVKTMHLINENFPNECLYTCEVGLYAGLTSKGISEYIKDGLGRQHIHTGIDNFKDKEKMIYQPDRLIVGNSLEVYNYLEDNSQALIFQDACHCFSCCVSSFFCYAPKVKVGGFMAWHDTGLHIAEKKDFQHGDKENPLAYISVRKALEAIGLIPKNINIPLPKKSIEELEKLGDKFIQDYPNIGISLPHHTITTRQYLGWELVYDEADETDLAGGVTVFQRKF